MSNLYPAKEQSMVIELTIPGRVVAKQSGKIMRNRKTGRPIMTTATKSVNYAIWVKQQFFSKYPQWSPMSGPLIATIDCYFRIPKSYTKKRIRLIEKTGWRYTGKPDADNIEKNMFDAMNGIAWIDDKQVDPRTNRWFIKPDQSIGEHAILRVFAFPQEWFA